ncbi:type I secretion system permease/ATPase [Acidiphilium sp.]|uniref:type I secretion system permease/ATPase n=1 Tax=Acidiphilium sp. TaxID=527 RepID=UPI00258E65C5|nr:type I secretion system permease/ATPase [Acidiphilium sp.]
MENRPVATEDSPPSSGIGAVVGMLRFHGLPVEAEQVRHSLGDSPPLAEIIRHLRRAGLRAQAVRVGSKGLPRAPLPAIAGQTDGGFILLAKIGDDRVLLLDSATQRPRIEPRADFEAAWDGHLILVSRRAGLGELARRFDITWFLGAVHKYRWILGEVLVASLFLQIFGLISPLFFQVIIDKVLVHRGLSTLDVLIVGMVGIGLFEALLGGLRTYVFAHTTNRIDVELGARLFRHLLALPLPYFQARRVGDSVARVREIENVRQFITGSALTLVIDLLFTVVFLAVMAVYSVFLTAIVLASLPLYVAVSVAMTPLFRHRLQERFQRGAENQAFLVEAITGVETLKSMAVEPQMQRRWEEQLAGYVSSSFAVTTIGNVATQLIQVISKLATAGVLFFGARAVMDGAMTVGELVAFTMLSGRVSQPVLRLAQIWQDFHQTRLSIDRLGDILNTPPEAGVGAGRTALPAIHGAVAFERVRFRHRLDGPLVLEDITLTVNAGEVVGIVGPSGSGKSTLVKLLQRLYIPENGRILIDGIDLAVIDPAWLRRQIGVVPQDSVLLNGTVRENIALADPGMPIERVIRAARMAGAHEFIVELPEGYDAVVGERGNALSGGQRQRIAIARALVTNPRILIFDEATSALDYESEQIVQRNLRQICQGRTVFIIAHRLSTVRDTDRIVALERGQLVEQGTHDELLRAGGRYASLHALQGGLHVAG